MMAQVAAAGTEAAFTVNDNVKAYDISESLVVVISFVPLYIHVRVVSMPFTKRFGKVLVKSSSCFMAQIHMGPARKPVHLLANAP